MEPEPKGEPITPDPSESPTPEPDAAAAGKPDAVTRFVAQLIDGLIAGGVFTVLIAGTSFSTIGYLLGLLLAGGYFLVRDGLDVDFMKQRSLGKKVMKLRPVRLDGNPMDLETSIKRNWMFGASYFGSLPFLGFLSSLIGLAVGIVILYECYKVLTDKGGRRWGDELAGTQVIKSDN